MKTGLAIFQRNPVQFFIFSALLMPTYMLYNQKASSRIWLHEPWVERNVALNFNLHFSKQ